MTRKKKKLLLDLAMYVLGLLGTLFMCLKIFANQEWAFYLQIGLLPPFYATVITEVVLWINNKKEKQK